MEMNSLILYSLLSVICITICSAVESDGKQNSPLFLTPYIQSGQIAEARNLSRVHLSSTVTSHSGFLTVDEINGAHTFFWFFPAAEDAENAPVIIWFEGGPGLSGLYSVFLEHGPFAITPDGDIIERQVTWTSNHSVIYLDQPMDVGYSFTENENGYVSWGAETANNTYNLLIQFFKMFPELQKNDFYCAGVSYGGIYAPAAAHYIHTQNQQNLEMKINLKGMLLETPWTDPISQVDIGEYLYHVGLIDEPARDHFDEQGEIIKQLISQGFPAEGHQVFEELIYGHSYVYPTYFNNVTGLIDFYNILREEDVNSGAVIPIAEPNFREFLHVGNLTFTFSSRLVSKGFEPKMLLSVKPLVEDLLNENYKVLIYAGQLDVITSHIGVNRMIQNLNWDGAEDFSIAARKVWRVNDTVAGYAKTARNFTQILVRNAGHGSAEEQPAWIFDLLNKFTQGNPF